MKGRKVPSTMQRAIAYLIYNIAYGKNRKLLKRQARREDRHYQKQIEREEARHG